MKKLLVVDGNSILNRSYYGIRPLTTKEGIYTNAVYGLIVTLSKQIEALSPDICAIAFDRKEPTFRHKAYDGYKAGRHPSPDELRMQFPYAKDCTRAMGFHVLECPGYEADDILGTLSREASEAGYTSYLLTGDRDALQLISDDCTVLLATNKETVPFDRAHFEAVYGVAPETFVNVKALMGDSSDNIPGVAGIGEKTALKLISDYGDLETLYEDPEAKDIAKGVKAKLVAGKDSAFFSRMLATIVRDAPISPTLSEMEDRETLYDREALLSLMVKLEFSALIKRMGLDEAPHTDAVAEGPSGLSAPDPCTLDAKAIAKIEALPKDTPLALYYAEAEGALYLYAEETSEEDGGEAICLRAEGDCMEGLCRLCEEGDHLILTHDAKTLYHAVGDGLSERVIFDSLLAGYLLSPAESAYTPERLSVRYLGQPIPEDAPAALLVRTVYALYRPLSEALAETKMDRLFREVELPLSLVLYRMEKRGFRVDTEGIRAYGEQLDAMCRQYTENIYMAAGMTFNINSPKQLGEVLFDTLGLPCPSAKRSTNAEVLEKLRPYHPIIGDILEYRQVAKLKSTYTDGLLKVADAGGRIHSSFNQTVTATGRLSSTEPNLQNIPIRTELGRELRRYFIAKDAEHVLIDADYSQIELRLLAAISGDETMTEAFKTGTDIHAVTASQVFRVPLASVTGEQRKRAKAVNFGIVYGIGDYSLAMDIGVTKKQAAAYIEGYLNTYPGVAAYLKNVVAEAKEAGYVSTLWGRRRYIPELTATKRMLVAFGERVAMNSPIQGSAADIIKAAMIRIEGELSASDLDAQLILQVHDELIVECHRDCAEAVKEIVRREMEHTIELAVPLTVDVAAGNNWYEGH